MNILSIDILSIEILDIIISFLNPKNKVNFISSFKYVFEERCTLIQKYNIYYWNNSNYLQFYECLINNNYTTTEINQLIETSIKNIPIIYKSTKNKKHRKWGSFGFYDMRYIFELLFLNQSSLSDDSILDLKPHFYIHFYKQIQNSIKSTRNGTIDSINNNKILIPLHRTFKGYINNNCMIELNLIENI